jgi:hypothetical protein
MADGLPIIFTFEVVSNGFERNKGRLDLHMCESRPLKSVLKTTSLPNMPSIPGNAIEHANAT